MNSKGCIWIVNPQTGSPKSFANPRYIELAKYFMQEGYEVITFNSSTREGIDILKGKYLEKDYDGSRFVHIKTPAYVGNGVKRMLSMFVFACRMFCLRKKFQKPDIVLQNIHPPFDYPIIKMAKHLHAKYVAEAWDLWPEDFVTFGLVKRNNPALKVAYLIERKYYYNADDIIFTFLGAFDYLKRQGWMKEQRGKIDPAHLHYINNGINLERFDADVLAHPRADADLNDSDTYKVIYLGSISKANNVKTLVDAAAILQDNPKYKFFFYGDGTYRDDLEQYVKEKSIGNVVFKERRIPYSDCAWVVSQATVNVMNYEKGFGHLGVSSGKMFQYLAAGKPIVCNIDIAYDDIITDNNLGVARDMFTAEEFAAEIARFAELPKDEYEAMCRRVRKVGQQFDYKVLAKRELSILEN